MMSKFELIIFFAFSALFHIIMPHLMSAMMCFAAIWVRRNKTLIQIVDKKMNCQDMKNKNKLDFCLKMKYCCKCTYSSLYNFTDQQVLWENGQMDRYLEDEEIKWEGVWKQFLAHLSVINMEKEQCGSAKPPTSRMLSCFFGRVKITSS